MSHCVSNGLRHEKSVLIRLFSFLICLMGGAFFSLGQVMGRLGVGMTQQVGYKVLISGYG